MRPPVIAFCVIALSVAVAYGQVGAEWWQTMSLYQIYPRSFKDSNGDGVGDLKGIIKKLHHLVHTEVDAFWLSPIYPSPMVDFGYDISDFRGIDPVFGTLEDFEDMVKDAHGMSLKVILDFVPNHSSDQHEWFQKSLQNIPPYSDYYVWHEGRVLENGSLVPPNNWVSVFGGPAWTWRDERQAFYLHQFTPEQPDLNYNNEHVVTEMKNVMRFWLNKGVDGFRVDAIPHLCEDGQFLDEPLTGSTTDPDSYGYTEKIYTKDQPQTYEIVRGWRKVLDEYYGRVMMMEAYSNISMTMEYYKAGANFPFNFGMITMLDENSKASDVKELIDEWMRSMPAGGTANWVAGNHDKSRLVTRFGEDRARAMTLLTLLLPGVGVTYNGEEIGMEDTWISWDETKDPQGCNAGKDGYETASRDPARTPYQWDNSVSAGFSQNKQTWLPINENVKTVNLAAEEKYPYSYYIFYKMVAQLRRTPMVRKGNLVTVLLNKNVLGIARESEHDGSVYAIINFGSEEETVDLSAAFDNVSDQLNLYYATACTDFCPGSIVKDVQKIRITESGVMIFIKPQWV